MAESIDAAQFHDEPGIEDWRVVAARGACAVFRADSFAAALELAGAIGGAADAAGAAPDLDLRGEVLTVRLTTHGGEGMAEEDVLLARRISAVAGERGATADPAAVQDVNLTMTTAEPAGTRPFWAAALGFREAGDEDLVDPRGQGPSMWFQRPETPAPGGPALHVDVWVAHDEAEARVAAAVAAGGRIVSDRFAPAWWTLSDAEGNTVDIATWRGRDGDPA
ncbi:VOC family protein [Amycolatopsis nivea]